MGRVSDEPTSCVHVAPLTSVTRASDVAAIFSRRGASWEGLSAAHMPFAATRPSAGPCRPNRRETVACERSASRRLACASARCSPPPPPPPAAHAAGPAAVPHPCLSFPPALERSEASAWGRRRGRLARSALKSATLRRRRRPRRSWCGDGRAGGCLGCWVWAVAGSNRPILHAGCCSVCTAFMLYQWLDHCPLRPLAPSPVGTERHRRRPLVGLAAAAGAGLAASRRALRHACRWQRHCRRYRCAPAAAAAAAAAARGGGRPPGAGGALCEPC